MQKQVAYMVLALIYLFAHVFLSFTPRQEFELLLIAVFLSFTAWAMLVRYRPKPVFLFVLALVVRLVFFAHLPLLSDDFYRFVWDGELLLKGINPIGRIPVESNFGIANEQVLLDGMNSAAYPSVYPPLHQVGMAFGALFDGILSQVNGMRFFIVLCEAIGLIYFWRFSKPLLSIYAAYLLNPLVVLEGIGNVHFEAALLPFLAVAVDLAFRQRVLGTALSLGSAILLKLNPLILLPAFLREPKGRKVSITTGVIVIIGLLPFLGGIWSSFEGIDLFFRSFEFNASIYYIASEIGKAVLGYNAISVIGPALGTTSAVLIVLIGLSKAKLSEKALMAYLIYLLFSSTVHPWYIIPVVYLALLTDRKLILIWSFIAFFSYSHYLDELEPKYPWLIAEYAVLLAAIVYEYRRRPVQLFRG